ncbi:uncharacterized protein F4807DRAFT_417235 [Annulohypoxylon truncatum]|uniref:uncharacterized protein n=1 Tax=Annulohypoxylon truncatum TaxID=327061 RepID=UPI0020081898|nr:uncharacterized protein F4807DRAFT_417235 [Annulohypoxylon truncatum]KAI1212005.1 hypothetical protein F4807DRAFT_417235 [Annulohypoxylon truncatum]
MDNWESQQTATATSTPQVKFEASPAESLMSVPGDMYPSLFAASSTLNSLESAMTPQSFTEEKSVAPTSTEATPSPAPENAEKKPTKKRKSWGQVLPEPKTNLPPRKRAKTEDEKEQRRVERVLRNRRAAQSSRERKRQEVEALEQRNQQLEELLRNQQKTNEMLMDELNKLRRGNGVSRSSSPLDAFQPSPLTLSQPLFGSSQNGQAEDKPGMMNDFILMPEQDGTVDPASLSPEITPVADDNLDESSTTEKVATAPASESSTDATQHPAAVLCDLQCPSVEVPRSWVASRQPSPPALSLYLQLQTLLIASSAMLSAFRHPLTLIRGALKANLVLHPTPSILSTIIWLVTRPPNFRNSTSTSSSAPTTSAAQLQAQPREATRSPKTTRNHLSASSTLRIKSLQKLLTSSPILARPLKDATMELLRLVSEKGRDDRVEELAFGSPGIKGDRSRGPQTWPDGTSLPSREVLLTLMWAITVEERKFTSSTIEGEATIASSPSSRPGLSSVLGQQTPPVKPNFVLSVISKGERDMTTELGSGNRIRLSP